MKTSETITKIAPALLNAQRAMGGKVEKGAKNPFFKSKYANLESVLEACVPHFNDAGITVLQPTVVVGDKNYVETILIHESGEFISSLTEIKVSKVNDAQAEGSGISYARRYGLQSFANLAAVDDDGQSAVGKPVAEEASYTSQVKTVTPPPAPEKPKTVLEQFKAKAAEAPTEKKTTKFVPKAKPASNDIEL